MKQNIAVFDSGFGGLTVLKELIKLLPNENIIYFGDTANLPYGPKSKNTIIKYSKSICEFLVKKDVKMIVVACNTASSFALSNLKKMLDIPIIGVIVPGAKKACKYAINNKIGVIGTRGTVNSNAYSNAIKKIKKNVKVIEKPCPLFVPLVEESWHNSKLAIDTANIYLKNFKNNQVDSLILGCTHYPLLKNTVKKVLSSKHTHIIDSAHEVALSTKELLKNNNILNMKKIKGKLKFYVTDDPNKFQIMGQKFLGKRIDKVIKVALNM